MKSQFTLLFCVLTLLCLKAQDTIRFDNASFEDVPRHSRVPHAWTDCGASTESPPDILPDETFQITKPAFAGKTYLGLVTRDNNTWESVGTELSSPIQQGQCYAFQIALAQSLSYYSVSRAKNTPANFVAPVKMKIWAGNGFCELQELLVETDVINHYDWRLYTFNLEPQHDSYTHLTFSVTYANELLEPTNGNLLLDAASPLIPYEECDITALQSYQGSIEVMPKPYILSLPEADELPKPDIATKRSIGEALSQIDFYYKESELALYYDEFRLEESPQVYQGSPMLYKIQYLLQAQSGSWELLVVDDSSRLRDEKVAVLAANLPKGLGVDLSVAAYSPRAHRKVSWYANSVEKGLYLRRIEQ